jgi:hypothetical protein
LSCTLFQSCERGKSFFDEHAHTAAGQAFAGVIQNILQSNERLKTSSAASATAADASSMDAQ